MIILFMYSSVFIDLLQIGGERNLNKEFNRETMHKPRIVPFTEDTKYDRLNV